MKKSYEEALAVYNKTKESEDKYPIKSIHFGPDDLLDAAFDSEQTLGIVRGYKVEPVFHDPETFYFFVLEGEYPGMFNVNESLKNFWESCSLVEINKAEFDEYVKGYFDQLKPEQKPTLPDGLKFYEVTSSESLQRDFIMETDEHEPESEGEFILVHWHTTA